MESNNSVPVTSSSSEAKTPGTPSVEKKVGFARPTLIIPPPQGSQNNPKVLLSVPVEVLQASYGRKTSQFMFDHINQLRDLGLSTAKTSLGFGEKFALWLYNKVKVWSKKWFTHCFLTIVLVIYTIGGAISFKTIEEPYEGSVERPDLRALRYKLIEEVTNLSRLMPLDNQTEQWNSLATERIYAFFGQVIEDNKVEAFIAANRGDKVWTIWNSVVFCATIYTTIAMESGTVCHMQQTPQNSGQIENSNNVEDVDKVPAEDHPDQHEQNGQFGDRAAENNNNNSEVAAEKLILKENKPEKDLPPLQAVPKKRRQKRRIINREPTKRESTPIRYLEAEDIAKIEDDVVVEKNTTLNGKEWSSSSASESISRQGSFRNGYAKKESISDLAQHELKSLFNKTKKSISSAAQRGRERFRKYEQQLAKRSQSAPLKFAEELQESLEKVQQNDTTLKRKYSDSEFTVVPNANCFRDQITRVPQLQLLRHRRPISTEKPVTSAKIIEVLDSKTSSVVQRRSITASGRTKQVVLSGLKTLSIKEFFRNFQIHKRQFHREYAQIKSTFRRCCCELFLIMLFCGLGGLMFKFTEGSFETYYKCGVKRVKRDFIDLLWVKSHNLREDDWKSLARSRLRKFEEELHSAHEAGMTDYSGMRSWSFLNGIVYCLTIVTTIGYGHMFPKTHTGRALTIVYALIGIPLFLIALTDFGKLFTRGIKFVWSFVRRLYYTGSCRKVRKNANMTDIFKGAQNLYDYATFKRPSLFDPNSPNPPESESQQQTETPTTPAISNFEIDDEFNLPISVALFILVSYIFCGAVMYMVIEKWNFFEAFYFVFISMSTIGFGDYVPRDPVFMIGSIIYLVFGLALMSMCINVVQAKLSDTFKQASSKIGATMGLQVEEDGSVIMAAPENIEEISPVRVEITNEKDDVK